MATNDPDRVTTFPLLTLGISMDKPAHRTGQYAVTALEQMHTHGVPVNILIGDRAYGNNPLPENYQAPIRAMGYEQIYDMKQEHLGAIYDMVHSFMLEGNAYSPAMKTKTALAFATRDYTSATPPTSSDWPSPQNTCFKRERCHEPTAHNSSCARLLDPTPRSLALCAQGTSKPRQASTEHRCRSSQKTSPLSIHVKDSAITPVAPSTRPTRITSGSST